MGPPVSLESIMEFMMKEKEDRAKEREKDKEEIKDMIVSGVKEEIQKNIKPLEEKQNLLETAQAEFKEKFEEMVDVIKELKSKADAGSATGAPPSWPSLSRPYTSRNTNPPGEEESQGVDTKVKDIIDMARRTVGLYKIDSEDLARMRQDQFGGATTEEEEKL